MEKAAVLMSQQFSGLPMDALIGGPLNAAATANAAMAITQTKLMLDTCFQKKDDAYSPVMIEMVLSRPFPTTDSAGNVKHELVETTFKLPMLTIVPINSLAVQTVDIAFEMEVKSSFAEDMNDEKSKAVSVGATFEAKLGFGPASVRIKGNASYDNKDSQTHGTHYQNSNAAKYTVKVTAAQIPMPKGVNMIIEAFAKAIEPVPTKKEDSK